MTFSLDEVVNISGVKTFFSKGMKNANSLAKEANKLAKSDPEKAKKKFDEAIDAYEQVKKNVHTEVKDDTVFN